MTGLTDPSLPDYAWVRSGDGGDGGDDDGVRKACGSERGDEPSPLSRPVKASQAQEAALAR